MLINTIFTTEIVHYISKVHLYGASHLHKQEIRGINNGI